MATITYTVAASTDDGAELFDGTNETTQTAPSIKNLSGNHVYSGQRWAVAIPQGVTILNATMQVFTTSSKLVRPNLEIIGFASDNIGVFTTTASDLGTRAVTSASVTWAPGSDVGLGSYIATPDFTAVVQEIVNRAGWVSNNFLGIRFRGLSSTDGLQYAAYDNGPGTNPPLLVVDYFQPPFMHPIPQPNVYRM